MSNVFPAATVVLVRDGHRKLEVLMLRRSSEVSFAPGAWVFPGGRIDDADYSCEPNNVDMAARVAAVRETHEEAGLSLHKKDLHYFAHWTAPEQMSKRFATWFFIAPLTDSKNVVIDDGEIDSYQWISPRQAVVEVNNKTITMMPPTFVTLSQLSQCQNASQALAMYKKNDAMVYKPKICQHKTGMCSLYQGDAGYEQGDASVLSGSRHRLWVRDTGWSYENTL